MSMENQPMRQKKTARRFLNKYWVGAAALALSEIVLSYNAIKQEKNILQYHKEIYEKSVSFAQNQPIERTTIVLFYLTSSVPYQLGVFQVSLDDLNKSLENKETIEHIESIIRKNRENKFSEVGGYIQYNKKENKLDFYNCMSLNEELMQELQNQNTFKEKTVYLEYLVNLKLPGYHIEEENEKMSVEDAFFLDLLPLNKESFRNLLENIKKTGNEAKLDILLQWLYSSSKDAYIPSVEHRLRAYFEGNFGSSVLEFHIHSNSILSSGSLDPSEDDLKKSYKNREIVLADFGANHFEIYDIKNGKYDIIEWKNGKVVKTTVGVDPEAKKIIHQK